VLHNPTLVADRALAVGCFVGLQNRFEGFVGRDVRRMPPTGGVVETRQNALVAAIGELVERAVALGHVDRLEDVEIGRILDHPAGVARRLVEVDDYRIERAFRIELAAEAADHLLIGPDIAEGLPGRKRLLFGDLDPRHARLRARGRGDEGEAGTSQQQQASKSLLKGEALKFADGTAATKRGPRLRHGEAERLVGRLCAIPSKTSSNAAQLLISP
jgi:hypothetical protein